MWRRRKKPSPLEEIETYLYKLYFRVAFIWEVEYVGTDGTLGQLFVYRMSCGNMCNAETVAVIVFAVYVHTISTTFFKTKNNILRTDIDYYYT
jgi:hypothetical protein